MDKIFGASYASVYIDRLNRKVQINWKGYLKPGQAKMVLGLVLEQVKRYKIETIEEDRSLLKVQNAKVLNEWCANYFSTGMREVKNYLIKSNPTKWNSLF